MSDRARTKCQELVKRRYFDRGWRHVCHAYRELACAHLASGDAVLDVGCGREFPSASWLAQSGARVFGVDVAVAPDPPAGVQVRAGSVYDLPFADGCFDLVVSSHVLEHLQRPREAFSQIARVLRPGGRFVFLAPSAWDYVSVIARLVPNAWHGRLVKWSEGREERDTFPTYFRANTGRQIRRLASSCGLSVDRLEYHNNYPSSLMFNVTLCRLGIAYDRLIGRFACLRWLRASLLGVLQKR